MWLGAHGIKYDREVMLLDPATGKNVSSENYKPMTRLIQELKGDEVVVTTNEPEKLGDRKKEIRINLDVKKPVGKLIKGKKTGGLLVS